ncbi:DUF4446 family protein [Patescibacteria group bacterium]|nr:DUF4446 family protein [Patescibacteria group bacterium]MBU0776840.1 DUF4446 family protein [Patescibacteria group bacterium]MBU0846213.1 DUF4446 family protein [Patescibacteria group bacterium]MBU0922628.1 DUF4446 family protein [Patescibacteria group bacterium]MBU1066679.1 DUF4446 family protein [Patescibacteria group bacterium]
MFESWQYIIWGAVGFWLFVLSIGLFIILRFFNRLVKRADKGDLKKVLEKVLAVEVENSKAIKMLEKEIDKLEDDGRFHVQKVGLVRFNPFQETGGDHSFSIALLDGKDTGLVLTGLHTRERTRVYAKTVTKGKSEHELSNEEKKAFTKAKRAS